MALRRKRQLAKPEGSTTDNLESMVKSGPSGAYEALQLYRSKAIRCKSKNDMKGALDTLSAGSIALLSNGYENAGAELTVLYLELLVETSADLSTDSSLMETVYKIDNSFPPIPKKPIPVPVAPGAKEKDKKSPKRVEFLKGALKWTVLCGSRELGYLEFHHRLADCLWSIEDRTATYHYAAGEAPGKLCDKIFERYPDMDKKQQQMRDRALCSGIVHFLSLENLRDANELQALFMKEQKSRKFTASSELLQFCSYLLQTCKRDAQPLFKTLVNNYASALDYDETVTTLITGPIAFKFFGITPKVNPMMSMLQNMIK